MAYDEPWYISEDVYPTAGEPEEKLRFMLNYAVLAPQGTILNPGSSACMTTRWSSVLIGHVGCQSSIPRIGNSSLAAGQPSSACGWP
jgi:hypothetical protein